MGFVGLGGRGSNAHDATMPKQSKDQAIQAEVAEIARREAHDRRVKEILEENEKRRTLRDRWIHQKKHLTPRDLGRVRGHPWYDDFKKGIRPAIMFKNEDGHWRYAIRRPLGGDGGIEDEVDPKVISRLKDKSIIYLPSSWFTPGMPGRWETPSLEALSK